MSNTGPQSKRRMRGFSFGIGNRIGLEDASKLFMPGPGHYYTKDFATTL